MPSLPLPFITSFFLFFVLLRVIFSNGQQVSVLPLFAIGAYGLQSALLGLIWGYEITFSLPVLAAFAVLIPPLTYAALTTLVQTTTNMRVLWILAPAVLVACVVLFIPMFGIGALNDMVDFIILAIYLFYGGLMIWIAMSVETEWMDQLPFQRMPSASRTFLIAGLAMVLSAAVDVFVYVDLIQGGGTLAPEVVGLSNLMLLIALGVAVLRMARAAPVPMSADETASVGENPAETAIESDLIDGMTRAEYMAHQAGVLDRLDTFMLEQKLYRDENLSLDRLARRTLIPARQISTVINNLRALNVPQYVNTFRIIEACERLKKTDAPITDIIYEVGFTTKSNFNREFQRIVGVSPSVWRRSNEYDKAPRSWPFLTEFIKPTTVLHQDFTLHRAEEST